MVTTYDIVDFISAARYERVVLKGHVTLPASGILNLQPIVHNLGYVPFYKLYVKYPDRSFYEPVVWGPVEPDGYFNYQIITGVIDSDKIELAYLNNTIDPDVPLDVYYKIYAEAQE